jgi:hypothetical protein
MADISCLIYFLPCRHSLKVVTARYPREPDATILVEHYVQCLAVVPGLVFVLCKTRVAECRKAVQSLIVAAAQRECLRGVDVERIGDQRIDQALGSGQGIGQGFDRVAAVDEDVACR